MAKSRRSYPGNLEQLANGYRRRVSIGGKRIYGTWEGLTLVEAEDKARTTYNELRNRASLGLPGPTSFSGLLQRFEEEKLPELSARTQKTYQVEFTAFTTYFITNGGNPMVNRIGAGQIQGFMTWRRWHRPDGTKRKKALSARSVAKSRATLHRVYAHALKLEIVPSNPVSKTDIPKGDAREPILLDDDQYEALLEACLVHPRVGGCRTPV